MKCEACGRILQEDARYCDFCGNKIPEPSSGNEKHFVLNKKFLFISILASLGITAAITIIAMGYGVPLFFGGLFLPFFFKFKPKKKDSC